MEPLDIELDELLGAYALDALEPDEVADVGRYLMRNPRARAEVQGYREVAALLANAGAAAPTGVWDSIVESLDAPAPPFQLERIGGASAAALSNNVVSMTSARRSRRKVRWLSTVAAGLVAASLIVGLMVKVNRQDHRIQALDRAMSGDSLEHLASAAMSQPGVHTIKLQSDVGAGDALAVMKPTGESYLMCGQLPQVSPGMTYQLWVRTAGKMVSLGVLGPSTKVMAFTVPAGSDEIIVTLEHAPGAREMSGDPVAIGTF